MCVQLRQALAAEIVDEGSALGHAASPGSRRRPPGSRRPAGRGWSPAPRPARR
jgi:hypothetical protein